MRKSKQVIIPCILLPENEEVTSAVKVRASNEIADRFARRAQVYFLSRRIHKGAEFIRLGNYFDQN